MTLACALCYISESVSLHKLLVCSISVSDSKSLLSCWSLLYFCIRECTEICVGFWTNEIRTMLDYFAIVNKQVIDGGERLTSKNRERFVCV